MKMNIWGKIVGRLSFFFDICSQNTNIESLYTNLNLK